MGGERITSAGGKFTIKLTQKPRKWELFPMCLEFLKTRGASSQSAMPCRRMGVATARPSTSVTASTTACEPPPSRAVSRSGPWSIQIPSTPSTPDLRPECRPPHFPCASTTRKPMVFRRVSGGTGVRAEASSSSCEAERQLPPRVAPITGFAGSSALAAGTGA